MATTSTAAAPDEDISEIRPAEEGPLSSDGLRRRRIREAEKRFDKEAPPSVQLKARGWGKQEAVLALAVVLAIMFLIRLVQPGRVFTPEELATYDGRQRRQLYLAVLGEVYDVSAPGGRKQYGEGGSYSALVGRDASRAFGTGDFSDDLNSDVRDFSAEQLRSLLEWRRFYRDHKDIEERAAKPGGQKEKFGKKEKSGQRQPMPCTEAPGQVSCQQGHPRKVLDDATKQPKCMCFVSTMASNRRRLYPGCAQSAKSCAIVSGTAA